MDHDHYIKKLKEHEENRTSTNDRNAYWKEYNKKQLEEGDYKRKLPPSKSRFEHGQESDMNWLKSRLKERTTLDGAVLVVAGVAMIITPINLIAYAMIAYGAWTMWKSE